MTIECTNCFEITPDPNICTSCDESPLLDGRYALQHVIGEGAHGTTYRATRVCDGFVVAVKEFALRRASSWKQIEQLEREAETLAALDHANVPSYQESFSVVHGRSVSFYIVQEFVPGADLSQLGRVTESEAVRLVAELLDTLADLHVLAVPVVHRDVKPSNVIRRPDGSVALVDFGSVRGAGTVGSTIAGTYGYMAPEQLAGIATPSSDVYAAAATLVALVTGRDASEFAGPGRDMLNAALGETGRLHPVLRRMLSAIPEKRPSAAAASRLLRESIPAASVSPTGPTEVSAPSSAREIVPSTLQRGEYGESRLRQLVASQTLVPAAIPLSTFRYSGSAGLVPLILLSLLLPPIALSLSIAAGSGALGFVATGFSIVFPLYFLMRAKDEFDDSLRRLCDSGELVPGRVTGATPADGRMRYHYVFQVPRSSAGELSPVGSFEGRHVCGTVLPISKGSRVLVAYDPQSPLRNMLVACSVSASEA